MCNVDWKLYEGIKEGRNAKSSMRSFEEFWNLLESENYTLLSPYKGALKKVKLKCPHNHEFDVAPNHFKNHGTRCPICSGNNSQHAKQEFEKLLKDEGYELLDKYKNSRTKVKMRCPHGHIFEVKPNNFKNGQRCPICSGSYGERTTYEYLTNLGLDFEIQKTFEGLIGVKNGGLLRYDFYIPSLNLLLEINGEQHYKAIDLYGGEEQLLIQIENDNRKKAFARAMGINLVEIKCYGEREVDKLKEELDKVINEYIFRFFGKAS